MLVFRQAFSFATHTRNATLVVTTAISGLAGCSDAEPQTSKPISPAPHVATEAKPVAAVEVAEVVPGDAPALPVVEMEPLDVLAAEALYHDPGEPKDYLSEALQLQEEGRHGEAIVALRHALFEDGRAATWERLGNAYLRAGDQEHGKALLLHAVSLDPSNIEARRALVRLNLNRDDVKAAKVHAEAMLRAAPDDVSGRYLAGIAYMKNSMWRQAMAQMEEVCRVEPTNIYAHNNAGFAALQVGDVQTALVHLEPIAQLADAHGYMLNNLGVAYERAGREAEAHAAFSRAVELRPGYVNGIINKERIEVGMNASAFAQSAEVLIGLRTPAGAGARAMVAHEDPMEATEADANKLVD